MTGSERIQFLVLLSAETGKIQDVGDLIARDLTQQFGGVTVLGAPQKSVLTGYWADDGHAFKALYKGNIVKEPVIGIMLSVLPADEERAFDQIRHAVVRAVSEFNLKSRYIHVETSSTCARHFNIDDLI